MIQPYAYLELKIDDVGMEGEGIAHAEEYTVFVPFALPGETVRAQTVTVNHRKRIAFARPIKILSASPYRVKPACPAFGVCGGCDYMHADYAAELKFKRQNLASILKKNAGLDTDISDVVPSDDPLGYRNKAQLVFGEKDGKIVLGFYGQGIGGLPASRGMDASAYLRRNGLGEPKQAFGLFVRYAFRIAKAFGSQGPRRIRFGNDRRYEFFYSRYRRIGRGFRQSFRRKIFARDLRKHFFGRQDHGRRLPICIKTRLGYCRGRRPRRSRSVFFLSGKRSYQKARLRAFDRNGFPVRKHAFRGSVRGDRTYRDPDNQSGRQGDKRRNSARSRQGRRQTLCGKRRVGQSKKHRGRRGRRFAATDPRIFGARRNGLYRSAQKRHIFGYGEAIEYARRGKRFQTDISFLQPRNVVEGSEASGSVPSRRLFFCPAKNPTVVSA